MKNNSQNKLSIFIIIISFIFIGVTLTFAATLNINGNVNSSGSVMQGGNILVPSGAVMAFYLYNCPAGWIAADGANGTPDLRGVFIRGTGTPTGYSDASGEHGLGTKQDDYFQGHSHYIGVNVQGNPDGWMDYGRTYWSNQWASSNPGVSDPINGSYGGVRVTTETRPKNVALLYCMKQ